MNGHEYVTEGMRRADERQTAEYERILANQDARMARFGDESCNELRLSGPNKPPSLAALAIRRDELDNAKMSPRCIVENHLYADLALLVAPGGTGKSTLMLYESICIALGRTLWGNRVVAPGKSLIITAEDPRDIMVARLREIMREMDLSDDDKDIVLSSVCIWDVTGQWAKLIEINGGSIKPTMLVSEIIEAYRLEPPAIVNIDPTVSFGASEQAINDNEQALVTAARQIIRALDCCVRYVHHTGKSNAREKTTDQYSSRGGTALPDGARMVAVMQPVKDGEDHQGESAPPGCGGGGAEGATITVMQRPKLSYAPPQPLLWIRRDGFKFQHFVNLPVSPEQRAIAQAEQLERYLTHELKHGRRYTTRDLEEAKLDELNLSRKELRGAIVNLRVGGRLVDGDLPRGDRQGVRKTYLHPANCAERGGAIGH